MIGQIIACPRCNMMVQVLPPAGYVAAEKPAATSPTKTRRRRHPNLPSARDEGGGRSGRRHDALRCDRCARRRDAAGADNSEHSADRSCFCRHLRRRRRRLHRSACFIKSITPAQSTAKAATPSHEPALAEAAHAEPTPPPAPATLPPVPSRWATLKFPAMIAGGAVAGAAIVATALTLLSGETPTSTVAANTNATPPVAAAPTADPTTADANAPPVAPVEPSPVISAGRESNGSGRRCGCRQHRTHSRRSLRRIADGLRRQTPSQRRSNLQRAKATRPPPQNPQSPTRRTKRRRPPRKLQLLKRLPPPNNLSSASTRWRSTPRDSISPRSTTVRRGTRSPPANCQGNPKGWN